MPLRLYWLEDVILKRHVVRLRPTPVVSEFFFVGVILLILYIYYFDIISVCFEYVSKVSLHAPVFVSLVELKIFVFIIAHFLSRLFKIWGFSFRFFYFFKWNLLYWHHVFLLPFKFILWRLLVAALFIYIGQIFLIVSFIFRTVIRKKNWRFFRFSLGQEV